MDKMCPSSEHLPSKEEFSLLITKSGPQAPPSSYERQGRIVLRVEALAQRAKKHFHTEVLGALPYVATITSTIVTSSPKDERG
ncbi:hypothetical protein PsB1_1380 [Candidatus Phycosocius spiralis]|uniref:Uncharacterized protein n=1 Tax=Candidatus Phycosocius spiralis TaxID=2815099 RepID=A0ABQ4PW05_9PROT|nr:hypothetical protein PsB1_1380 [Candidatus Phycosocius spiralis]